MDVSGAIFVSELTDGKLPDRITFTCEIGFVYIGIAIHDDGVTSYFFIRDVDISRNKLATVDGFGHSLSNNLNIKISFNNFSNFPLTQVYQNVVDNSGRD